jgi:2'-5' RNA ligase
MDEWQIYETLWNDAVSAFGRGEQQIDRHLSDRQNDSRRGVTIILRPSPAVLGRVKDFLDQLARAFPDQHFYRPEELHVTVLSIISGSESWRKEIRQLIPCRAIISEVLSRQRSFRINFRGVTASPGSVMIQGFPTGDGLERIRFELREAFARNGLGGLLDRRYEIRTAHMTAMRFSRPEADWQRLISWLKEDRDADFGETEVRRLQLIWGDWCASAGCVRTLQEYRLMA